MTNAGKRALLKKKKQATFTICGMAIRRRMKHYQKVKRLLLLFFKKEDLSCFT